MKNNILKADERRNPVTDKSLGNKNGVLINSEREKMEKDWREQISPDKLEEISKEVPQELWNRLSFYKQLIAYEESKKEAEKTS